jgi:hypothetical protein
VLSVSSLKKLDQKKMHRLLPCAVALQIIEIPHDLAAAHA